MNSTFPNIRLSDLARDEFSKLPPLDQSSIDWLKRNGVPVEALYDTGPRSDCLKIVYGNIAKDGWFDQDEDGEKHIASLVYDWPDMLIDVGLWQPRTGKIGSFHNRAFAFGEHNLVNPGYFSFKGGLHVHKTPLDWLKAGRDGICIIRPEWASLRLLSVPKLVTADAFYGRKLQKLILPKLPEIGVIVAGEVAA